MTSIIQRMTFGLTGRQVAVVSIVFLLSFFLAVFTAHVFRLYNRGYFNKTVFTKVLPSAWFTKELNQ